MYEGLLKTIKSLEFILDLALLCDTLKELSELSLDLQSRDIRLTEANTTIQIFTLRHKTWVNITDNCDKL